MSNNGLYFCRVDLVLLVYSFVLCPFLIICESCFKIIYQKYVLLSKRVARYSTSVLAETGTFVLVHKTAGRVAGLRFWHLIQHDNVNLRPPGDIFDPNRVSLSMITQLLDPRGKTILG